METTDLLKKVRRIEIKTRGLSRNIFAGEYHSAFKGRGMAFSEVREYSYGDDMRDIDWNVTARYNKPFVKVFEEERELTVMLLIDVSESLSFGTSTAIKRNILAEIAATLAFSAIQNNDKIGVIFFSDKIEKFVPPKKGRKHILYIIREILSFKPDNNQTDISMALRYLTNAIKIANRKHDLVSVQVYDRMSTELKPLGLMKISDPETGNKQWIDTSSKKVQTTYRNWWINQQAYMQSAFKQSGVDSISVSTDDDYVKSLLMLFQKRG